MLNNSTLSNQTSSNYILGYNKYGHNFTEVILMVFITALTNFATLPGSIGMY